jgi:hypothetical protein
MNLRTILESDEKSQLVDWPPDTYCLHILSGICLLFLKHDERLPRKHLSLTAARHDSTKKAHWSGLSLSPEQPVYIRLQGQGLCRGLSMVVKVFKGLVT